MIISSNKNDNSKNQKLINNNIKKEISLNQNNIEKTEDSNIIITDDEF